MKQPAIVSFVLVLLMLTSLSAVAQVPGFGELYYEDTIVHTVVPPAAAPLAGVDDLYRVTNGVEGQLAIAAVAPGNTDYHGGKWAVHLVTWTVTPLLLTSEADVLEAAAAGEVIIERVPQNDFKCPVQPKSRLR